jgi:hypothetical protein
VIAAPGKVVPMPISAAPWICASIERGLTGRLQCTPAVTAWTTGAPSFSDASTT